MRSDPRSTLMVLKQIPDGKKDSFEMVKLEGCVFQPDVAITIGASKLGKKNFNAFYRMILLNVTDFRGWVTWPGGNWAGERIWMRPLGVAIDPSNTDKIWDITEECLKDKGETLSKITTK